MRLGENIGSSINLQIESDIIRSKGKLCISIEEWYNELIMTLKEIIAYKKLNFFKRNPSSCDKWAGCIFKQWCNEEPKRREQLINMTYKIGEVWDVGKGLEKK